MQQVTPVKRVLFRHCPKAIWLGLFAASSMLLSTFFVSTPIAQAATDNTLNFQARLETSSGAIVPDGTYNVEFKLYDNLPPNGTPDQGACTYNGGTTDPDCLWTETRTSSNAVRVANGYLSVDLGSVTPFPSTINWDQNLYLSLRIGGTGSSPSWDSEMSPRLHLTGVPYAFQAQSATQLQQLQGSYTNTLQFATDTTQANTITLPDLGGSFGLLALQSASPGTAIAKDTFQRPNQTYWGTASDGNVWGADAATNSVFTISGNTGVATNPVGIRSGTLGASESDEQVVATGSTSTFSGGDYGVILRYVNGSNWYKAYIDGSNLLIRRDLGGTNTVLTSVPFAAAASTSYTLKFQAFGNSLLAKVWPTASSEPSSWMLTTQDSSLTAGEAGVQVSGSPTFTYTSFAATSIIAPQTGNFNISGSGLLSTLDGTGSTLTIGSTNTNTGAITIGASMTNGTVAIGGTSQTGAITLGQYNGNGTSSISIGANAGSSTTQNVNIGTSGTTGSTTNVMIGSAKGGSTTIQSSGITQTIAGSDTIKSTTNSTTAFQVQNSSGSSVLNADTTNNILEVNGGTGSALGSNTASNWSATTVLGSGRKDIRVVAANGYVYAIGGGNTNTVTYSKIQSDGTLGSWSSASLLPQVMSSPVAVTANNTIYVIGGSTGGTVQNTVFYAHINSDGSLGSWATSSNTLPAAERYMAGAISNGYLYVLGGYNGTAGVNTVYYARITSSGDIGSWSTNANNLAASTYNGSAVVANGYIYFLGGNASSSSYEYAQLNSNGSTGAWTLVTAGVPNLLSYNMAFAADGNAYVVGGYNGTNCLTSIEYASLGTGGALGSWSTANSSLPLGVCSTQAALANGYTYIIGGTGADGTTALTTAYYISLPRTQLAGSLDLVGLNGGNLANSGSQSGGTAAGSLAAGNTNIVGTLQVQDIADFNQGVSINGILAVASDATFANSTNSTSAFQVQNAGGNSVMTVDTTNGQVALGKASAVTGKVVFNTSAGANSITLQGPLTNPTGNYTLTIPTITANANLCTDNSVCTGYAPVSGSGSYVQLAPSSAQADTSTNSSIFINKTGASGNLLELQQSTDKFVVGYSGAVTQAGNLTFSGTIPVISSSGTNGLTLQTNSTGTLNIGTTNAATTIDGSTLNIGNSTSAHTINIGAGGTAAQAVNIGSSSSTSSVTIQGGTGTSVILQSQGTIQIGNNAVAQTLTIGNGTGATTVSVLCGTGTCGFGNNATDHSTTIGSTTGTSLTTIQGGTGGVAVNGNLTIGTNTIIGSGLGDELTMNGASGYTLLNGNNGWGINAQADYLRLVGGGLGYVQLQFSTDTNLSRGVAGVLDLGNGTYQDHSGTLIAGTLDAGTFDTPTAAGTLNIGTTNAAIINIGQSSSNTATIINGTALVKPTSGHDSTTAFQVQNASGNNELTVDTSGDQVILGKAGPSGITGALTFQNSSNANAVTIRSGATSSAYALTLPTAQGSSGQCLQNTDGAGTLGWTSCYAGAVTLQQAYNGSAGANPSITLSSTNAAFTLRNSNITTGTLFGVQDISNAGTLFSVANTGATTIRTGNATNNYDTAGALQVQNHSGTNIFSVDTSAGQTVLGAANAVSGSLVFENSGDSNTITLKAPATTNTSYYLNLPTSAPSAGLCLATSAADGHNLVFSSCTQVSGAVISYVNEWDANGSGITTLSVSPTSKGDLLLLTATEHLNGQAITNISGGDVTTWSKVTYAFNGLTGSNQRAVEMWRGVVTSLGTNNITVTYSGSPGSNEISATEYTIGNSSASWNVDTAGTLYNSTSSTTITYPNLTPQESNELYAGYGYSDESNPTMSGSATGGSSTGFTYKTTATPANDDWAYNTAINGGTPTQPTATQTTSGQSLAVAAFIVGFGANTAILNSPNVQSANFNVQAATSGSVTGVLQGDSSGTADILDFYNGTGGQIAANELLGVTGSGNLVFGNGSSNPTINVASATTGTALTIQGGAATSGTNVGGNLVLQGGAGASTGASGSVIVESNGNNSTTAFQVQNASGYNEFNVDTSGNKVTLGNITTTAGHAVAGTLVLADGTIDGFGATLNTATLTASRTIHLPDASGTLCLDSGNCSAAGGYILNQNASPQTANFNISGTGIVGALQVPSTTHTAPSLDTTTASGELDIGTVNAHTINFGYTGANPYMQISGTSVTVGSPALCTIGRFCVAQASTNANLIATGAVMSIANTIAGKTNTGSEISIADTSSPIASTIQGLVVDTSGTTNTSATVVGVLVNDPSANGGNLLQLESGGTTVLNVSNSGATALKTTSASAFNIQTGGSAQLFNVDTSTSAITIGTATNGVVFTAGTLEPVLNGTARHQKTIDLSPEFVNDTMTAPSSLPSGCSGTSGTMTSDMDTTNFHNYYNWTTTQASNQCYDIWVRIPVPDDFAGWGTQASPTNGPTISVYGKTTDTTNGTINLSLWDTGNSSITLTGGNVTPTSTGAWQLKSATSSSGTYSTGQFMTLKITVQAPQSGNTQLGEISMSYLSKW